VVPQPVTISLDSEVGLMDSRSRVAGATRVTHRG